MADPQFGYVNSSVPIGSNIFKTTFSSNLDKYILCGSSTLLQSSNGLDWDDLARPSNGNFIGVAAINLPTTRGWLVLITATEVWERDSAGTWTDVTPVGYSGGQAIAYLPGTGFCIIGTVLGVGKSWLSNDGVTWINGSDAPITGGGLHAGGGRFIRYQALSGEPNKISISIDGSSWSDTNAHTFTSIVTVGSFHYAIAHGTPATLWISTDLGAETWTQDVFSFTGYAGPRIDYYPTGNLFLGFTYTSPGNVPTLLKSSNSGISWTSESFSTPVTGTFAGTGDVLVAGANIIFRVAGTGPSENFMMLATGASAGDDIGDLFTGSSDIDPPEDANMEDATWSSTTGDGQISLNFNLDNEAAEEANGIIITRESLDGTGVNGRRVIATPDYNGNGAYDFVDVFNTTATPNFHYSIYVYSAALESISEPAEVLGSIPDIDMTGSGGIDLGGAPLIVFIGEPSGIYTLVKDKTHDTLYERQAGTTVSIDVKIPDPYIKTGFISGND